MFVHVQTRKVILDQSSKHYLLKTVKNIHALNYILFRIKNFRLNLYLEILFNIFIFTSVYSDKATYSNDGSLC